MKPLRAGDETWRPLPQPRLPEDLIGRLTDVGVARLWAGRMGGCVRGWVEDVVAGDPTGSGPSANSGLELTLFRHRHRHRHRHGHGHGHGHGQSCNSSNDA